jgi:hypothetical protein
MRELVDTNKVILLLQFNSKNIRNYKQIKIQEGKWEVN